LASAMAARMLVVLVASVVGAGGLVVAHALSMATQTRLVMMQVDFIVLSGG
jgi:hypothetical protein